ncbi:hypothetical protein FHS15_004143 [Paenibacillus castaneae]|uniref:hypothetical protein n=1 Tax=Paenibacillus castaneae TaxID=474957 RepID=UPI000C9B14EA|nr:hypothetical protein [Paenibacillus castaneae]NIK78997.1 hypothetical protein [Paenibacillus castaneae]
MAYYSDNPFNNRQKLIKQIDSRESQYNSENHLLKSPFSSPGYHTTIKQADFIHSTRNSLVYALGLLDTEEAHYEQRAFDIIEQVISLQDTDRSRSTFGIWSWFYEEPLDQMSPPDWNWADFCGKLLVLIVSRHSARLPEKLRQSVQQAIYNACDAIIIRNVGPNYTNIAIMGAFVTLIAGELFEREDYAKYGFERLGKLHNYTLPRQAFLEYNSPTYTQVAILELSAIVTETNNAEAKLLGNDLLDIAWKSVADHFHTGTRQWSGPHSRCYKTLLTPLSEAFLQFATGGKLAFYQEDELPYDEGWYKCGVACPEQYIEQFLTPVQQTVKECYGVNGSGTEKWATTYMTPTYSLGSFKKEIMWNQTRTLLAYVDNGGKATYLHLRALHDGYDYCSAVFHGEQRANHVLFGMNFVVNGGDTHPNLDMIDGSIEVSDFRFRLEIGGALEHVSPVVEKDSVILRIGETLVSLRTWFTAFDDQAAGTASRDWSWEVTKVDNVLGIDLVLHTGEKRVIDFQKLNEAAFLFSLCIGEGLESFKPQIEWTKELATVSGSWNNEQIGLALQLKPGVQ